MQENGLDLCAIDPRHSEKYSPNLYQWLTKRDDKMRAWASRVYPARRKTSAFMPGI